MVARTRSISYEVSGSVDYIEIILISIAYGIYLALIFMNIRLIINNAYFSAARLGKPLYLLFEGLVLLLSIPIYTGLAFAGLLEFIPYPAIFSDSVGLSVLMEQVEGTAQPVSLLLGDAFLIYRCYKIFNSHILVIVFPSFCLIGYFVLSMFSNFHFPVENLTRADIHILDLIGDLSSVLMLIVNPIVTVIISVKIYVMAWRIRGASCSWKSYTNVSSVLIESAAPWTVLGVLSVMNWITPISMYSGAYIFDLWTIAGLLSPQLIIFRVAMGAGWNRNTLDELSRLSTISFGPVPPATEFDTRLSGSYGVFQSQIMDSNGDHYAIDPTTRSTSDYAVSVV